MKYLLLKATIIIDKGFCLSKVGFVYIFLKTCWSCMVTYNNKTTIFD